MAGECRKIYPIVARVDRKWLEVPETSTPSERMLLIYGLVDTSEWSNLLVVLIEKRVFRKFFFH